LNSVIDGFPNEWCLWNKLSDVYVEDREILEVNVGNISEIWSIWNKSSQRVEMF